MVDRGEAREAMELATRIAANAHAPELGIRCEQRLADVLDHVEDAREAEGGLAELRTALRLALCDQRSPCERVALRGSAGLGEDDCICLCGAAPRRDRRASAGGRRFPVLRFQVHDVGHGFCATLSGDGYFTVFD